MIPPRNKLDPVLFLKNSHHPEDTSGLTAERMLSNRQQGVITTLIPDANVMVRIERATDPRYPATETTLEHFGIKGLYDIFRFAHANACPISFSPAIALSEMPADKAATAATRYFAFTQRFGLDLTDDPDQGEFPAMGYQGPPSIWSVDDMQRKFMAVNYTHQLLMLYIRHTGKRRTPLQNFDLFLYEAVSNSFFLSTRDIAIARYVFADSEKGDESVKKICREVRKNFCKFDDRDP